MWIMPLGTPEEYQAAVDAETADIELRDPGRGEYNMHRTVESICRSAVLFEEFVEEHALLESQLAVRAVAIEARHRITNPFKRFANKVVDRAIRSAEAIGEPYAKLYAESTTYPPIPWAFPF